MSVPDFSTLAQTVFSSYPEDVTRLNALCDQCEADRAAYGEADPRVQAGESTVNNLKGLFTRRIAWACAQQDPRFGLRRKTSGALATRGDGVTHSTDALMLKDDGQIVDCMSDRKWSWGVTPGDTQPLDQWIKALPPEGEPVPAPTPVPVPSPIPSTEPTPQPAPTVDLDALAARVTALYAALEARVTAIEQRPVSSPPPAELPKLMAVGKIHLFGFDYNVHFPVVKA